MKVFKNGVPGEIYNIGPKKVSLNYILKTIENLSEKKIHKTSNNFLNNKITKY